ncbi:MAG: biotin/lipoyl-containing protein, partial [Pollutimonas bauzanensis]
MGTHIIKMPDIGEGIAEVELVEWHVQPGDSVVEDQLLADVMTDKATVQVPSPVHGKVVSLGGAVGEVMAVGSELIRLEVEGAGNAAAAPATARSAPASAPGVASGAEASTASAPAAARDQAADRPSSVEPAAASAAGVAPDAAAQPVPAPQPRRAEQLAERRPAERP